MPPPAHDPPPEEPKQAAARRAPASKARATKETQGSENKGTPRSSMLQDFMSAALQIIPRLRTPIQLAGLLFTVLAAALIRNVDPNNIRALLVTAGFGIAMVVLPLAFHHTFLKVFAVRQRALVVLTILALVLISMSALAYFTISTITHKPSAARFDSELVSDALHATKGTDGIYRGTLRLKLFPLMSDPNEGATIWIGMVTVHDAAAIDAGGLGSTTSATCDEVPSCVGAHVYSDMSLEPTYVRGGSPGATLAVAVNMKKLPDTVRVWWIFFQQEGHDGTVCRVNNSKIAPKEGIPFLGLYDSAGNKVSDLCYRSRGMQTVKTILD